MAEIISGRKVFSLHEVGKSIQRTLKERYTSTFWVKAELHKLNYYTHSGHCYPELLEKKDGKIIAQFRSIIWNADFERINTSFRKVLKETLKDGIVILFEASVQYDPVYELSLRIHDIDPSFSLGELERERIETIEKLKKEGIFNKNKSLGFPELPQRLAIISVETSKGYADFLKVIDNNPWGYKYFHLLFPALLQGEKAVDSIVRALRRINRVKQHFDLVMIIRGGGGDVGLSCYNHYNLAKEIALFPLPVLSGVGHATNETIAELVSNRHFITPTEAGTFLLQSFHNLSVPLQKVSEYLRTYPVKLVDQQREQLLGLAKYFVMSVKRSLQDQILYTNQAPFRILNAIKSGTRLNEQQLQAAGLRLHNAGHQTMLVQMNLLNSLERQTGMLDPALILKRGFSITLIQGKAIHDAQELETSAMIETILFKGRVISRIEDIYRENNNE